jgi:hypothetical protein
MHGSWGGWQPKDDGWQKFRPKTKKKFKYQWEVFNAKDIESRGIEMLSIGREPSEDDESL